MNTTSTSQNEQEYLDLPDFKDILDPLSFVVEESGVAPTKRELGRSYYKLAKIHYDKSDLGRARHYFERALALCELPRDVFAILKVQGFLIRIFSEALEQNSAMEMIQKCEKTVEELTQILGSLTSEYFYNVGLVKNYRGEFAQARENFELAYKKSREENEPDLQAKSLLA
jgi:tetratricopeptide (TPR) repeat protein